MIKNLIATVEVEKAKKYDNLQIVLQTLDKWLAHDERALAILEHIRLGTENGYLDPTQLRLQIDFIVRKEEMRRLYSSNMENLPVEYR